MSTKVTSFDGKFTKSFKALNLNTLKQKGNFLF